MNAPNTFHAINSTEAVWFAPDACLELRPASAACGQCRERCPTAAIVREAEGMAIGADCIGCGRCGVVCPTGAISVSGFAFPAPADDGQALAIECRRVPPSSRAAGAAVVPCLHGLAPTDLLALVAAGHGDIELVDRGWCAACPAGGDIPDMAGEAVATAAALLAALGLPAAGAPRIVKSPLPVRLARPLAAGQDLAPLPRRAFFGALLRRSVAAASPPPAAPASTTRGACRPSPLIRNQRRQRADSLLKLARRAQQELSAAFFPTLEIGPACGHHGVCAAVCPSGALSTFAAEDGTVGLEFDAEQCLACGLCVHHCPAGAVRLSPFGNREEAHQTGRHPLVRHQQHNCAQCGKPFVDGAARAVCPNCRQQREMLIRLFGTTRAEG